MQPLMSSPPRSRSGHPQRLARHRQAGLGVAFKSNRVDTREVPPLTVVPAQTMKAPRMADFRNNGDPQTAPGARFVEYEGVAR